MMNPFFQSAVGSMIRWALALGAGWLVERGLWSQADAASFVAAASLALLSLAWSLYQKFVSRQVLMVALTVPHVASENAVRARIASGQAVPTVTTPPDTVPGVPR